MPYDISLPFQRFPLEIRQIVWEWAMPDHGMVVVRLDNSIVKNIVRMPHPLMHACHHSRSVFLSHFPDTLALEEDSSSPSKSKKRRVAVNFAHDLFYLPNLESPPESLRQVRNIVANRSALNAWVLGSFFESVPRLQRFWVCLTKKPEQFYPMPAVSLRRHCGLHHCDELPAAYISLAAPWVNENNTGGKEICPACRWHLDMFSCLWLHSGNFKLMLDPALPMRPTIEEILDSKSPALSWIRIGEDNYNVNDEKTEFDWEKLETWYKGAEACLTGKEFNCSH
ncbi:hypothetical protein F5Y19DRAFT_481628 [Xylariaceae sp. FL1651]|nr:hypothetical protein F5Y19DRAFT_481628 [Xylariaceae sp. FL1651]